jgi:hypothetical protein
VCRAAKPLSGWSGAWIAGLVLTAICLCRVDSASADTFCVEKVGPDQAGQCTRTFSGPRSLQAALDAARERIGGDEVWIGRGEFADGPYCYASDEALVVMGGRPRRW